MEMTDIVQNQPWLAKQFSLLTSEMFALVELPTGKRVRLENREGNLHWEEVASASGANPIWKLNLKSEAVRFLIQRRINSWREVVEFLIKYRLLGALEFKVYLVPRAYLGYLSGLAFFGKNKVR